MRRAKSWFPLILVPIGLGCGSEKRAIRVPASALAESEGGRPAPVTQPYVIKFSDGQRTWQLEIPAGAGAPAFEASIPLEEHFPVARERSGYPATEADRELLDAKRARGEPVPDAASGEASGAPPSYLRALAGVRALYRQRQYELALVELVRLERAYPDDVRILEMKGTLLARLGRSAEARTAWERVLTLDPDNTVVLEALDALSAGGN